MYLGRTKHLWAPLYHLLNGVATANLVVTFVSLGVPISDTTDLEICSIHNKSAHNSDKTAYDWEEYLLIYPE